MYPLSKFSPVDYIVPLYTYLGTWKHPTFNDLCLKSKLNEIFYPFDYILV